MEAIKNIKTTICNNVTFSINSAKGYPELSWVDEQTERLRAYVKEGLDRMTESKLFTKDEVQHVANFAEQLIVRRSKSAHETLRELKRNAYKF